MTHRVYKPALLACIVGALVPSLALAHSGDVTATGFVAGLLHPWTGADHIAAMVAAGIWATRISPRATLPFLGAAAIGIAAGATLGTYVVALTLIETITALSCVALGLLVALSARVRLFPATALVGLFCLFHGYVHAVESPHQFSQPTLTIGFLSSMLALQLVGALLATWLTERTALTRSIGACCAVVGLGVLLSA